ncbi:MAG: peptidoglycan bridge formation glycyltransferase FemA/FemB family protein [Geminicoccaceae bacterium]
MSSLSATLSRGAVGTLAEPAVLRDEWNDFVASFPAGDIVQSAAWADAKSVLGYRSVLAVHREGTQIAGGAAVLVRQVAPLLAVGYVPRGPLVAPGVDAARVVDVIERAARRAGVSVLVVQPPVGGEATANVLARRGYVAGAPEVAPSVTMSVDIAPEPETIMARMAPGRRRSVRQAVARGVSVRFGGRADLEAFHALAAETARRQQFSPVSLAELKAQWDALHGCDAIRLVLAEHEERMLAGIVVTTFGRTVTFRHTGWNGERPDLQANVACHWFAMQWARQAGYTDYDLGGVERSIAMRIEQGESLLADFQRSPAGYKAAFGGRLVWAPLSYLKVIHPLLGPLARPFLPALLERGYLRRAATMLRRGGTTPTDQPA